jgi:hypothetical protein
VERYPLDVLAWPVPRPSRSGGRLRLAVQALSLLRQQALVLWLWCQSRRRATQTILAVAGHLGPEALTGRCGKRRATSGFLDRVRERGGEHPGRQGRGAGKSAVRDRRERRTRVSFRAGGCAWLLARRASTPCALSGADGSGLSGAWLRGEASARSAHGGRVRDSGPGRAQAALRLCSGEG